MTQPSALHDWPLTSAAAAIAAGKITARALAEAQLARIAAPNRSSRRGRRSMRRRAADADRAMPRRHAGRSMASVRVKDIVATSGFRPGWLAAFAGHRPGADAACTRASRRQVDTVRQDRDDRAWIMHQARRAIRGTRRHTPAAHRRARPLRLRRHVCGAIARKPNGSISGPRPTAGYSVSSRRSARSVPPALCVQPVARTLGTFTAR